MIRSDLWDEPEWGDEGTSGVTPPPGYVPLEMPELWEPDPAPALAPAPAPVQASAPDAAATVPQVRHVAPAGFAAPVATAVEAQAVAYPPVPRSFDELRRAASLAGRVFADLSQLAVAAVRDAGHDPVGIARLFRVPQWKLQQWLDAGPARPSADPGPYVSPRRR